MLPARHLLFTSSVLVLASVVLATAAPVAFSQVTSPAKPMMAPAVTSAPAPAVLPTTPTSIGTGTTPETVSLEDTQLTLTAIPPRLGENGELKVKPGEKIQATLKLRNASNKTLQVESFAQDFIIGEDGTTPVPVTDEISNRWSLAKWLVLSPNFHTLKPNEITAINVIIDVPKDALPGGHYAMVTHQPKFGAKSDLEIQANSASGVNQRVGSLLYVQVEGAINEQAFIRDLNFPKFLEFGPVPFSFVVENQSDIHIRPQIGVDIYNWLGQKVETIQLDSRNIFPMMNRKFDSQWDRVWGIGPYTARITMSYGQSGGVTIVKTGFWLIPIKLVLAAVVVILALIATGIVIRRHLQHRKNDDKQRIQMLEQRLQEMESSGSVNSER